MSDKAAEKNGKGVVLPQFMNENNRASVEIEEKQSWLNNNLHKLMIGISAVWFAFVLIYITQFFGWSNLFLMMPDEFGGFLAGVTLPLAVIWVVMAYIDRGTSFKQEAKFLRAYMNQLVYPESGAPQTAKAMADAIRSQVVELQQVSKLAHEQTSQIKDAIKENVDDFAKLVGKLDTYSSKTIVELNDGVRFLMSNFENILNKTQASTQNLVQINHDFIDGGQGIEHSLSALFDQLLPRLKEIKETAEGLKSVTSSSVYDISSANKVLQEFVEKTNASISQMSQVLTNQTESLQKLSEQASNQCYLAKNDVAKEIANMEDALETHKGKFSQMLSETGQALKTKLEEVSQSAASNLNIMNSHIQDTLNHVDTVVDKQIQKIDDALTKHNNDLSAFVKLLDEQADDVNKKFTEHGEFVSQEVDKLMVRGSSLEESIALQISNLKGVSDQALASMTTVEHALLDHSSKLGEVVAAANDDLLTYTDALYEKTVKFEDLSSESAGKIVDLTDLLSKKYDLLQHKTADGVSLLQGADKAISSSTENLILQTDQSVESLNRIASLMQKQTSSLTETSSIVVTQSQISEASLAQQQKYITDTAARVEEIKNELKRQINDLSDASDTLEKDATHLVELLKSNVSKMLENCNEAINKSKTINSNLADQSHQFDLSANETMAKVAQFESILTRQSQNMEALAQNIDERSSQISKTIDSHTQKLDETVSHTELVLNNSIENFDEKSSLIQSVSQSASSYITAVANGLDEKTTALNILFKQQEADFYAYSEKASEQTKRMDEILQQRLKAVEESADKLFTKLSILEENAGHKAAQVVDNSQKSVQQLSEIEKKLSDQHLKTEETVNASLKKLDSVNETVKEHLKGFNTGIVSIKDTLNDSLKEMDVNAKKLKELYDALDKDSSQIHKNLDEQTTYLETVKVKLISQTENISNILDSQKNNLSEVVNNLATQARLGEASLAQQYKYLTDALVEVSEKMKVINDSFKQNTGDIFDTANKLSYEFDVLGDKLLKTNEDLNKATKDSMKSIDQTSLRLNQYTEDLDAAIFHSVENIGGVFNEYEKYIAGFNTVTAETSTGVMEINNLISVQSDKMVKISDDTKKLVDCFNTVLNDTSNQLAERANDAYDKVQALGKDLKKLGFEMDEAAKLSATHFEQAGDKLRASINEVSSNAERISNSILSSGDVFVKQSQALTAVAEEACTKVVQSLDDLVNTGKAFESQGEAIVNESLRFNDTIAAQTKTLTETALKSEKVLKDMTTAYKDIKIDAFLSDAGKIIAKLESVSVDINRLLNPKDEEDLWKKFYNGDTQVFIRALSKKLSSDQIGALRKEFEKNEKLREMVNSYMKEFETLVDRSKLHEHSATLMAVISGADLGRLYYVLAKALNKLN